MSRPNYIQPLPTIFLDMDGVISDWNGAAHTLFGCEQVENWRYDKASHAYDNLEQDVLWERLNEAGEDFWTSLPKFPWSDTIVDMVAGHDPNFAFITSPSTSPEAASGKMKWLKVHYPKYSHRFILTKIKETCAAPGRVLIDDTEDYCAGWTGAGGNFVLCPSPWNRLHGLCTPNHLVNHIYYALMKLVEQGKL